MADLFGIDTQPEFLRRDELLPLNAPQQALVGSVADAPQEKPSAFRDFSLSVGGGRGTLLGFVSSLFGKGTDELAAERRRELENKLFEQAAQRQLTATPKRDILKDVAGRQRFLDTGEAVFPDAQAPAVKQTALQEKITTLMKQGLTERVATGIATGQFVVSRDPVTNVSVILDKATNRPVDEPAPEQTPLTQAPLAAKEPAQIDDITSSLGASGFAKSVVNEIADLFGADLPFQQASQAAADLKALNLKTLTLASSGISGRPNRFFQEKINDILVQPNSVFDGRSGSINKFRALADSFRDEIERVNDDILAKKFSPATIGKAKQHVSSLRSLVASYDSIVKQAQPKDLPSLESFRRKL